MQPSADKFYSWLFQKTLYRWHEMACRRRTLRYWQFLNESQYWPPEQLANYVSARRQSFLQLAYAQVPFYRKVLAQAHIDLAAPQDFARVPFVERLHLQENFADLCNLAYAGKTKVQATGGSAGVPVRFCTDAVRDAVTIALRLRSHRWHRVSIGDKEVVVWGSPIELGRQDFLRRCRDWLFRSKLIYAFNFSDAKMREAIEEILRFQPRQIFGYAQSLHALAQFYLENFSISQPAKLCDVIFTTAEPLFDYQREDLQRAFGACIAVEYGARDAGLIAHECPAGNMHVNAESILVEIIDGAGRVLPAGEIGEIVVTNFDTPSMPIIRYRTGDVGALLNETCPCGVTLPLMKVVGGRMSDFLLGADGRKIHPLGGIYILREIENIRRFRIIQNQLNQIDLLIAAPRELDTKTRLAVQKKFDLLLGTSVNLSYHYLNEIETSGSGKFRHVICKVNPA